MFSGTVPGPQLFGAVFDKSCILWQEQCGETGACLQYDNADMSLYMFIVCLVVKLLSLIFIAFAWKTYKSPKTEPLDKGVEKEDFKQLGNGVIENSSTGGIVSEVFQADEDTISTKF